MAETVKKPKAAAKPRKTASKKKADPVTADPVTNNHHGEATERSVSHADIANLAHTYWKERGHKHGHHEEDWLRAEQELRGKAS